MNPAQLLAHFDRISDAPDAIPRLRRFILDLAVRGKLIEQDPRDEPASELLKRIDAGRLLLQGQGKSRKQEFQEDIDESEHPFELPASWLWSRLGNIGDWGSGSTPPRGNSEYYGGTITWLKSGELGDNLALRDSEEKVTPAALQKCSFRLNQPGDVLIAMYGATIGKLAILAEPAVTNQAVCGCTPFAGILNRYLFIYLLSRRENFHAQSEGGAQPNISKVKIVLSPVALPPLAEQHRIVVKVDELMALCDRLEAAQTERESRRDRLVASSLTRLNNGADAAAFRDHARFYFNHLPRLTTGTEHIQQLRQTIFSFAVRGKLLPQDPSDEPASELLKRIQAEKTQQLKLGKLKQQLALTDTDTSEVPFEIPATWWWCRVDDCFAVGGGIQKTPTRTPKDNPYPYIGVGNVYRGRLDLSEVKQFELLEGDLERFRLVKGDVLVVEGNGSPNEIGRCAMWSGEIKDCVHQNHIIRCRPFIMELTPYVLRFLNSPQGTEVMKALAVTSSGLYSLSVGKIRTIAVPLPPLAEQHRIVAKVDELMVLCDRLEAQLTTTHTDTRRLLDAVLHGVLT